MYDVLTSNLIIREWLNGSLFPLSGNLAFIIMVFLIDSFRQRGNDSWWTMPGVPTGCALFWVFSLDMVRAVCVWYVLRANNDGKQVSEWVRDLSNWFLIFASLGLVITMLRCTYLFTPPRWGNSYWVYSALSTIAFLLLSHFFPSIG